MWTCPISMAMLVSSGRTRNVFLEEYESPYHAVPAIPGVGGRGRVDARRVERPARDGAVGHGVVAFQHRDLVHLLLRKPVPLVAGTVGEARGLANAIVVDPVVGD